MPEPSRDRSAHSARASLDAAQKRDAIAHARDVAARARDEAANARDAAMAALDAGYEHAAPASGAADAEQRSRAAQHRAMSAMERALAAADRERAAQDREDAARERSLALADLQLLAQQLAIAETDALTGARTRAAGLADLDRELDRCRRTSGLLVVAYVDVVGLKALNDSEGHAAGDELLKRTVALIGAHLRSYDLIIRLGGDEFLCAMSNMTLTDARRRFRQVAATLRAAPRPAAIRTGFAQLTPDQTASELIARADSELINNRRGDSS